MPRGEYPHQEGDYTVIGPECFAAEDESVISWRGTNYVRLDEAERREQEAFGDGIINGRQECGEREKTFLRDLHVLRENQNRYVIAFGEIRTMCENVIAEDKRFKREYGVGAGGVPLARHILSRLPR